jgi:uncharacterized membrane protein
MKGMIIAGVLLLALGIAAFMGLLDFTEKKEILQIGDLKATVSKERTVPQWAGLVGIIAGVALVIVGSTRKR